MMRAIQLAVACGAVLIATAGQVQAGIIGIAGFNSNAAISALLSNNGHSVVDLNGTGINAASLAGLDTVILLRTSGNSDLQSFVLGGGRLITEWDSSIWALNTANLLQATDSTVGFVEFVNFNQPVAFTSDALTTGLSAGMSNPYADGGRTEFFRELTVSSPSVLTLATRTNDNAPVIIGGQSGLGSTLIIGYDWADSFGSANADTQQLILNAVEFSPFSVSAVPEPSSLALFGIGACVAGVGAVHRRRCTMQRDTAA